MFIRLNLVSNIKLGFYFYFSSTMKCIRINACAIVWLEYYWMNNFQISMYSPNCHSNRLFSMLPSQKPMLTLQGIKKKWLRASYAIWYGLPIHQAPVLLHEVSYSSSIPIFLPAAGRSNRGLKEFNEILMKGERALKLICCFVLHRRYTYFL